jgi:hypothetical protein
MKTKIVAEIDTEKLCEEFSGAYSNAIRRRLLEAEFARQLMHEGVRLALKHFHKWYSGEKTFLHLVESKTPKIKRKG